MSMRRGSARGEGTSESRGLEVVAHVEYDSFSLDNIHLRFRASSPSGGAYATGVVEGAITYGPTEEGTRIPPILTVSEAEAGALYHALRGLFETDRPEPLPDVEFIKGAYEREARRVDRFIGVED